jgi:hypothetical protein
MSRVTFLHGKFELHSTIYHFSILNSDMKVTPLVIDSSTLKAYAFVLKNSIQLLVEWPSNLFIFSKENDTSIYVYFNGF